MIIVKFQGRLGNQIFIYAFALSISKKFKTFFLIDNVEYSVLFKYFKKRTMFFQFSNNILLKLFKKTIKNRVYQMGVEDIEVIKRQFTDNSYYDGFFQSENYFEKNKEYFLKKLRIRKKYRVLFSEKFGHFFNENKVIAIHCRLGDYLNWEIEGFGDKDLTLPQSYYENAINQIDDIDECQIIIVTDDVVNIENKFNFLKNKIIVSEEEIIDFQILQNAHKLIISNSSFSWWAAYLNNKNAIVYAPEYWLGFKVEKEFPVAIIPNSFIKIPVW